MLPRLMSLFLALLAASGCIWEDVCVNGAVRIDGRCTIVVDASSDARGDPPDAGFDGGRADATDAEDGSTKDSAADANRCVLTETCDGVDNDCDGAIDEGLSSLLGSPIALSTAGDALGPIALAAVAEGYLVGWTRRTDVGAPEVLVSRVTLDGTVDGPPVRLHPEATTPTSAPRFSIIDANAVAAVWAVKQATTLQSDLYARRVAWEAAAWSDPALVATNLDSAVRPRIGALPATVAILWTRGNTLVGRTYDASLEPAAASSPRDLLFTHELRDYEIVGVPLADPYLVLLTIDRPFSTASEHQGFADRLSLSPLAAEMRRVRIDAAAPGDLAASFRSRLGAAEPTVGVAITSNQADRPAELIALSAGAFGEDIAIAEREALAATRGTSMFTMLGASAASDHGVDALVMRTGAGSPPYELVLTSFDQFGVPGAPLSFGGGAFAHQDVRMARHSPLGGAVAWSVQAAGGAATDAWLQRVGCE